MQNSKVEIQVYVFAIFVQVVDQHWRETDRTFASDFEEVTALEKHVAFRPVFV